MQPVIDKRKVIIIGGLLVIVVVAAILATLSSNHKPATKTTGTGQTNVYHDPVSGKDIVTQKDKTPESQIASSTIPTFAGFDALLDSGMTLDQVQSLYGAFEEYQPFDSNKILISLASDDLSSVQPDNNDPNYRWSFTGHVVVKNGNQTTTYHVQLYYWNTTTAELVLYNADGSQQVFDSGPTDTSDANS